jgi:hypothetical protein
MPRGLALIESLRQNGADDDIFVLCFNDITFDAMTQLALSGVKLVTVSALEAVYPSLTQARAKRSLIEFYYTCTPAIAEYALLQTPEARHTTYLDADLWFFANPELVFAEIGDAATAIIPHNFANKQEVRERFGIYNVGWVTFARSEEGLRCLAWWRDRCIEWCYGRIEGKRFADQGYLSQFVEVAPSTRVIRHKGCNTAPWNVGNYKVRKRDTGIFLDEDPLIFFHFHGVDRDFRCFYFDSHRLYGAPHTALMRNHIYRPYVAELLHKEGVARPMLPLAGFGRVKLRGNSIFGLDLKNMRRRAMRVVHEVADLASGRPILVWNGRAY